MVKKWEYKIISGHIADISQAGQEGWEFASLINDYAGLPQKALMKRPIENKKQKRK